LILNIISYYHAFKILADNKSIHQVSDIKAKTIYKPGILLFLSGLGSIIVWNTDNIVISKYLGLKEVAIYSTTFRFFSFAFMSFGLIYGIIIPYYGKFFAQKNWVKLQHLFNFNMMTIPFIAWFVCVLGWLFSREIIFMWLSNYDLFGGSDLFFILGAYGLVLAYVGVMFNFLTTLNLLKGLVFITIFEALLNLILTLCLVQYIGNEGVALGTLLGSVFGPLLFLPFLINKNKKIEFHFPFEEFLKSLVFYSSLLTLCYFIDIVNFSFLFRIYSAISLIIISILFQINLNKKTLNYLICLYRK
jgi:O-antigen/teichoic acid export membrane protein